jgi:hypothetical protein
MDNKKIFLLVSTLLLFLDSFCIGTEGHIYNLYTSFYGSYGQLKINYSQVNTYDLKWSTMYTVATMIVVSMSCIKPKTYGGFLFRLNIILALVFSLLYTVIEGSSILRAVSHIAILNLTLILSYVFTLIVTKKWEPKSPD